MTNFKWKKIAPTPPRENLSPRDHEIFSWWGGGNLFLFEICHHKTMIFSRGGVVKNFKWKKKLPPPYQEIISWSRGDKFSRGGVGAISFFIWNLFHLFFNIRVIVCKTTIFNSPYPKISAKIYAKYLGGVWTVLQGQNGKNLITEVTWAGYQIGTYWGYLLYMLL